LVAAFFTWARGMVMLKSPPPPAPEFGCHFSLMELFSYLFFERIVRSMFDDKLLVCPSGATQQTLGEVCSTAKMHYNYFVLARDCRPSFDAVLTRLFGSTDLDKNQVGFIIVQVKNDSKSSGPNTELFRKKKHCSFSMWLVAVGESGVDGC
jgi:hypothetical protein